MNRLGMVIAISHASLATAEQTIELSSDPVIASHDGLKSLNDVARTVPEDLVKKLAAKRGVFCVHLGNEFHNRKLYQWKAQQARGPRRPWDLGAVRDRGAALSIGEIDRLVAPRWPEPLPEAPDDVLMTPDDWIGVVDRIIQIAGEDHVAWGSDFDGSSTLPRGMRDARDLPLLTEAMLRRGYSEARIRKVLGENMLRVFRQITEKPSTFAK
jgi:membrane dipeptidase